MTNKALGIGIIVTFSIAFLSGVFGFNMDSPFFLINGFAIVIFGIWGSVRLIKNDN